MDYIIKEQYEGKEIVNFNLGQYCQDTFGIDSEDIPSIVIIGRVPEHMADLTARFNVSKADLSQLAGLVRGADPSVDGALKSRGF